MKKKPAKQPAKKTKKIAKKPVKLKKVTAKKTAKNPNELFNDWYSKVASKKVDKIEKKWTKENKPNDPDEEEGGDYWYVNEMMFNGDAHENTSEIAEQVFLKGYNNEPWEMNQGDSLYCELDEVIELAYQAGKEHNEMR